MLAVNNSKGSEELIDFIRQSIIGNDSAIQTPFGVRPLVYADYTASGRSLDFIEEFINKNVLPYYGNTHTETSACGRQTTAYREQARTIIKKSVNADNNYAVIFCGSGATAAINKFIGILHVQWKFEPEVVNDRPVVFIGPYEHHSNELPWRELDVELVVIGLSKDGIVDIDDLEKKLNYFADRKIKIGSFSAGSNVTGILTDTDKITSLLHQHNALACWDYAAAAPYLTINVCHPGENKVLDKDAVFISPHKFVGGPGTPGILIVNKKLLQNFVPTVPAGGTVSFVTPLRHTYLTDSEAREEGGTPGIVESIRAGLVFQLKDAVGVENIEKKEQDFVQRALTHWRKHPNIHILGNCDVPRLGIISLQIKVGEKLLHYGLVTAILNDLFGIQVRGGCSCAGPYAHSLLGMKKQYSDDLENAMKAGYSLFRPGWVRLNFNYFLNEETFDYLLHSMELIAGYGWKLLHLYHYDNSRKVWLHNDVTYTVKELNEIQYVNGKFTAPTIEMGTIPFTLSEYLEQAEILLKSISLSNIDKLVGEVTEFEHLRWYVSTIDFSVENLTI